MVVKSSLIVKSEQEQNLAERFPQGSQSSLIYERDFFNLSKLIRVSPNRGQRCQVSFSAQKWFC